MALSFTPDNVFKDLTYGTISYHVYYKEGSGGTYADIPGEYWLTWTGGSYTFSGAPAAANTAYYIKLRAKTSLYADST